MINNEINNCLVRKKQQHKQINVKIREDYKIMIVEELKIIKRCTKKL